MGEKTEISWCDATYNPWWGCIEVSPACDNCYARTFAKRTGHDIWGPAGTTGRRFFADKHWNEPLKWQAKAEREGRRIRVFCASMADVFEQNEALDPHRERLWDLISDTPMLDWLLLTKRPQNIRRMVPAAWLQAPRPNVWYGTTAENQHYADQRIPILLDVPAAVRFLSMEPLLGPVDLGFREMLCTTDDDDSGPPHTGWDRVTGRWGARCTPPLHWIITGGESGAGARPAHPEWYRSLRDQCIGSAVSFHFKQWGEWLAYDQDAQPPFWKSAADGSLIDGHVFPDTISDGEPVRGWLAEMSPDVPPVVWHRVGKKAAGRLLDGRTWDEIPEPRPVAAGARP